MSYEGIDFKPPAGAASAAQKAIDWKKEHGSAVKGGTQVGWTRASQLVKGDPLSPETVKRMYKFFQRHQKNKAVKPEYKDEPWRDNGYVAWLIWGGDAGKKWAETKWNQMERAEKTATSPLRTRPDYGEKGHRPQDFTDEELVEMSKRVADAVNPYLNTPPTKLKRDLEKEKDPAKKKKMKDALNAWRVTTPGPFWKGKQSMNKEARIKVASRLLKLARRLVAGPKFNYGDEVQDLDMPRIHGFVMESRKGGREVFLNMNKYDEDGTGYWKDISRLKLVKKHSAKWAKED